ncbi:MAG: hypothetical protein IJW32_00485 [Clostridia bacterium]|nr:hypothetical protein [Clostridia bacterium]
MKFFLDLSDRRLPFVKEYLQQTNKQVESFNKEDVSNIYPGDVIVVSPAFKWNETLVNALPNNITIFAGSISEEFLKVVTNKNIKYINFMIHEDFVLKNATLTAEGMLADLILNTKSSMYNQQILILGSGRVAKAVGYLFYKLGLTFDFAMRNEKEYNHTKLFARKCFLGDEYKNLLKDYDVVINTIPAVIFDKKDADKFKKDCYVFELASKQCLEGVSTQNFNYVLCPALPSKYTPKTAADLMIEVLNLYL